MTATPPRRIRLAFALTLVALASIASACGGDDDEATTEQGSQRTRQVEKAFLTGMVHHHETAIAMANIARRRGEDAGIRSLGATIETAQEREIAEMRSIHGRLLGGRLVPDPRGHDGLGLSASEAGMTHDTDTNAALSAAEPFDSAFVAEMIPHHRGAIAMVDVVLDHTADPALRKLANGIVRTQRREIDQMEEFRGAGGGDHMGGH